MTTAVPPGLGPSFPLTSPPNDPVTVPEGVLAPTDSFSSLSKAEALKKLTDITLHPTTSSQEARKNTFLYNAIHNNYVKPDEISSYQRQLESFLKEKNGLGFDGTIRLEKGSALMVGGQSKILPEGTQIRTEQARADLPELPEGHKRTLLLTNQKLNEHPLPFSAGSMLISTKDNRNFIKTPTGLWNLDQKRMATLKELKSLISPQTHAEMKGLRSQKSLLSKLLGWAGLQTENDNKIDKNIYQKMSNSLSADVDKLLESPEPILPSARPVE